MESFIEVRVETVAALLSETRFYLPWFQRAYAWREEHAGRLLVDVLTAMSSERRRYFLGHIRLAKPNGADAALIDGQQRAITLTILIAALRDMMPRSKEAERLDSLVKDQKQLNAWRLTPQPIIAPFFAQYVQNPGATALEPDDDIMSLAESERTILANRNHLRDMLAELVPQARRAEFASFLLDRCVVIVEAVEDEEEAWAMLATEEETGLAFHSSERAKLSLISIMPRAEQEAASRMWETCQGLVGADDLSRLLGHIRALKLPRKSSKPVEKDLAQRFELNRSGMPFIEKELQPRAHQLARLKARTIGPEQIRPAVADALETLWWLEHQLWLPPALNWLSVRGENHAQTARFFFELDRLSWLLQLAGIDPTDKERRYLKVSNEIEKFADTGEMGELVPEPKLIEGALANLRSRTFYAKHYSSLVLRRLSRIMGADPGPSLGGMTIEHVLPRKPPRSRAWWRDFRDAETVAQFVNRLGNLVLLTEADNQRAGTADYVVKREILSGSGQILSVRLAGEYDRWTAQTIESRTESLIRVLLASWNLRP